MTLEIRLNANPPRSGIEARLSRYAETATSLLSSRLFATGFGLFALMMLLALFAPAIAPRDPYAQDLAARLLPPSAEHWFGTDNLGRDIWTRVVHGSRITAAIVFVTAFTAPPIGLTVGLVAGYFGGGIDAVLTRITDIFLALPRLVLALALAAALGPGLGNALVAIVLTAWPAYARLARAEARRVRSQDYVAVVRLLGASDLRILLRHVLPMVAPITVTRMSLDLAGTILLAAGLGFLGLGAQPPLPEWGAMVATGRDHLVDQWWIATLPGAAILLVSLAFNLMGDGARDAFDPRRT